VEADTSDRKLEKLVDDNATAFAALGLGTLPGRDSGKQVHPASRSELTAAHATPNLHDPGASRASEKLTNIHMLAHHMAVWQ
jgi:hypothetical protein